MPQLNHYNLLKFLISHQTYDKLSNLSKIKLNSTKGKIKMRRRVRKKNK